MWCAIEDFDRDITFIVDSKNTKLKSAQQNKARIWAVSLKWWWTVINLPDVCFSALSELVEEFGVNEEKIWQLLQQIYNGTLNPYRSVYLYLFSEDKLLPLDPHVRQLQRSEKDLFTAFRAKCTEEENYQVYMDFDKVFHRFYAYFDNNEIVSLWTYFKINDDDKVVLPSIITREEYRWKWYGKAVVNLITHKLLEEWFTPRYRADPENIASRGLAKALWYEELFEWFLLSMI